ncbi:hypothetical protein K450DRAFT_228614 [Umbelopsis ramanniana AG]|uniref:Transmembrane protein n=1 Tax=Umbelopsis ramanniana AG TaxID=1314678 RepID=A0AAD5EFP9_UMBRA|nr:uncharacterized protein K450DRAFT_228614 [Umbelopsis ramanniana AG]KAI8582364.1 hypothetical protein K450DRAFT_228614 [Umbelopsis ramanniana AG]
MSREVGPVSIVWGNMKTKLYCCSSFCKCQQRGWARNFFLGHANGGIVVFAVGIISTRSVCRHQRRAYSNDIISLRLLRDNLHHLAGNNLI